MRKHILALIALTSLAFGVQANNHSPSSARSESSRGNRHSDSRSGSKEGTHRDHLASGQQLVGKAIASSPTVMADRTALATAAARLKADQAAGMTMAIAADQAAVEAARRQLVADRAAIKEKLAASAQVRNDKAILKASQSKFKALKAQLQADLLAGNTAAVAAGQAAIEAARVQVASDRATLQNDISAVIGVPLA